MRYQGKLNKWDDDKGFGFIVPSDGGAKVFVHIKAFHRDASRPVVGDLLSYELEFDSQQRPRAGAVRRVGEKLPVAPDGRGWKAPFFGMGFCVFLTGEVAVGGLPSKLLLLYVVASLVTFLAYWWDKKAAQAGRWRTAENTLHLFGLIGGWPGGLAAQRMLRHKSIKQEFQVAFWGTAVMNCVALGWLLTGSGRAFLHGLGV